MRNVRQSHKMEWYSIVARGNCIAFFNELNYPSSQALLQPAHATMLKVKRFQASLGFALFAFSAIYSCHYPIRCFIKLS